MLSRLIRKGNRDGVRTSPAVLFIEGVSYRSKLIYMANYWIEDYESGEWYFHDDYEKVLKTCQELLKKEPKIRVGYVMFEIHKLQQASKSDLVAVVAGLEETGKYVCRLIKYKDSSDFIVTNIPKKSFWNGWFLKEIVKWAVPIIGASIISYFIGKEDGQSLSLKDNKIENAQLRDSSNKK